VSGLPSKLPVDLKDIFRLKKQVGKVPFSDVVRESSGFEIIPVNDDDAEDAELLRHLRYSLASFIRLTEKAEQRFRGNRINEVGRRFENMIVEEVKKTPIEIRKLGASGYPDFELKQRKDRITYLEIKSTANPKADLSTFRAFYYSSGRKIQADARHLLVKVQMEEEANKYWKVLAWELRDLSTFSIQLKTEFYTGFSGMAKAHLLDSSTIKRGKNGQSKL
jgi:hypothetical protein